jgi:hypothetical protein
MEERDWALMRRQEGSALELRSVVELVANAVLVAALVIAFSIPLLVVLWADSATAVFSAVLGRRTVSGAIRAFLAEPIVGAERRASIQAIVLIFLAKVLVSVLLVGVVVYIIWPAFFDSKNELVQFPPEE